MEADKENIQPEHAAGPEGHLPERDSQQKQAFVTDKQPGDRV